MTVPDSFAAVLPYVFKVGPVPIEEWSTIWQSIAGDEIMFDEMESMMDDMDDDEFNMNDASGLYGHSCSYPSRHIDVSYTGISEYQAVWNPAESLSAKIDLLVAFAYNAVRFGQVRMLQTGLKASLWNMTGAERHDDLEEGRDSRFLVRDWSYNWTRGAHPVPRTARAEEQWQDTKRRADAMMRDDVQRAWINLGGYYVKERREVPQTDAGNLRKRTVMRSPGNADIIAVRKAGAVIVRSIDAAIREHEGNDRSRPLA